MLVHADKYGFIAIDEEDTPNLLEGVRFMDSNECKTTIPASRGAIGLPTDEVVKRLEQAMKEFNQNAKTFRKKITE